VVDAGDQLPYTDGSERWRIYLEIFQEPGHLRGVGQRGEWGSAQGREDQEVQPHAHREVELSHESQDLPGRVPAPENFSSLRVLHVGNHAVAVLDIGPFHRDEHDVGVIPVDHEVCRVRQQCVVIFRVDVRGGGTRLSHREADQMPAEFDAL
jgi:hypothetical protein